MSAPLVARLHVGRQRLASLVQRSAAQPRVRPLAGLHCTALHGTALHCTALHCTALHCTALRTATTDRSDRSGRFDWMRRKSSPSLRALRWQLSQPFFGTRAGLSVSGNRLRPPAQRIAASVMPRNAGRPRASCCRLVSVGLDSAKRLAWCFQGNCTRKHWRVPWARSDRCAARGSPAAAFESTSRRIAAALRKYIIRVCSRAAD